MLDLLSYVEALTAPEVDRKAQLEATIERGMQTFVEVGLALMEIRDGRLYRAEFGTFEEYCQERWGWGRNYINKLIASAEVVENLGTIVPKLPATERQARPLAALPPAAHRPPSALRLATTAQHQTRRAPSTGPTDPRRWITDATATRRTASCSHAAQITSRWAVAIVARCAARVLSAREEHNP